MYFVQSKMPSGPVNSKSSPESANREQTSGHSNVGAQNRSTHNNTAQTAQSAQSDTRGVGFINPINSTIKAIMKQPTVNGK
jgi:hypothetical protein